MVLWKHSNRLVIYIRVKMHLRKLSLPFSFLLALTSSELRSVQVSECVLQGSGRIMRDSSTLSSSNRSFRESSKSVLGFGIDEIWSERVLPQIWVVLVSNCCTFTLLFSALLSLFFERAVLMRLIRRGGYRTSCRQRERSIIIVRRIQRLLQRGNVSF